MPIEIGIVGAGNRGKTHARSLARLEDADVVAVADIDQDAANELADEYDVPAVYGDFRDMLDDASLDAISVCVHNNLHAPVTIPAAEAGCHVFCEKPIAATYHDGKRMVDAVNEAGVRLDVQNGRLFSDTHRAASRLVDDGALGDPIYARGSYVRRRGRPFVDGYGTPGFVQSDHAGGGAVIDIGVYVIGQLLHLVGNGNVERVSGRAVDQTGDGYDPELVGADADYRDRVDTAGYDVEDLGFGTAYLEDGTAVSVVAAWHLFGPSEPMYVAGTKGGVRLDEFEYYTTDRDYEATVSYDLGEHTVRRGRIDGDARYQDDDYARQFHHWIQQIQGTPDLDIPTGELALNAMMLMEGMYLSEEEGRELTAAEIDELSSSSAVDL